MLELKDLTPDELACFRAFEVVGSIRARPGSSIRGDLVSQILLGEGPIGSRIPRHKRFGLEDAYIDGAIDLSDSRVGSRVVFYHCVLSATGSALDISRSELAQIDFVSTLVDGDVVGRSAKISGDVSFQDSIVEGRVALPFARVGGDLVILASHIGGRGASVDLDGARISGLARIQDSVLGERVSCVAAQFERDLGMVSVSIGAVARPSTFDFGRAEVSGALVLRDVRVDQLKGNSAKFGSDLFLVNVRSFGFFSHAALDRVAVDGAMVVNNCVFRLGLTLTGARADMLNVEDSKIVAAEGNTPGFSSDSGRPETAALAADGMVIANDLRLGPRLDAVGEIRFIGASVGGQVRLDDGFEGMHTFILNMEQLLVASDVFLDEVTPATTVHLAAAQVGGILLRPGLTPRLSLARTRYERINYRDGASISVAHALELIESDDIVASSIEPYRTLARWFAAQGDDRAYRDISIAGERSIRSRRARPARVWSSFFRFTVGYGYAPLRALRALAVLIALASFVFALSFDGRLEMSTFGLPAFAPVTEESLESIAFNPVLYAISVIVPGLWGVGGAWIASNPLTQFATLMFQISGWVLVTSVVAGVATRLSRS